MMTKNNELKPGDVVAFDVEGNKTSPYGFGRVVAVNHTGPVIKPDYPLQLGLRLMNIRALEGGR